MTICWKCGRETSNNDSECDDCAVGGMEAQVARALRAMAADGIGFKELDFSKIVTLHDHAIVLRALLHPQIVIPSNHPAYEQLKPYFKK